MKQERLVLPREMQAVDLATIQRQPSMSRAIVLCADMGGFQNDKDLCRAMDFDPATWSQIQTGARYFPQDKYERLFDECANEAPLIWLADRRGYELVPKETEMQRRLRLANEALVEERKKTQLLTDVLKNR